MKGGLKIKNKDRQVFKSLENPQSKHFNIPYKSWAEFQKEVLTSFPALLLLIIINIHIQHSVSCGFVSH